MKIIAFVFAAAAMLAAQDRPAKTSTAQPPAREHQSPQAQKPASPSAGSQLPSLPAAAVLVEPNLYRYTDAQGKTWMYRRTPFGFSKWEDLPAPQPVVQAAVPVKITDLGESVQFERQMPFGTSKWIHKKTELTEDEKAWLDGQQAKPPAAPGQAVGTPARAAGTATEKQ